MEGIVYKVQTYQEHSRLLFTYTNEGKVTLIARGAEKLNAETRIMSQYLTQISFEEQKKSMYALKNPKLISSFDDIKESFEQTKQAALILEIIDKIVKEDDEHLMIYEHLKKALSIDIFKGSVIFAIKILKHLGYALNFDADGRKVKGFSISESKLIYEEEKIAVDIDYQSTIDLLKIYLMPYDKLMEEVFDAKRFLLFIKRYYEYHLNYRFKTI